MSTLPAPAAGPVRRMGVGNPARRTSARPPGAPLSQLATHPCARERRCVISAGSDHRLSLVWRLATEAPAQSLVQLHGSSPHARRVCAGGPGPPPLAPGLAPPLRISPAPSGRPPRLKPLCPSPSLLADAAILVYAAGGGLRLASAPRPGLFAGQRDAAAQSAAAGSHPHSRGARAPKDHRHQPHHAAAAVAAVAAVAAPAGGRQGAVSLDKHRQPRAAAAGCFALRRRRLQPAALQQAGEGCKLGCAAAAVGCMQLLHVGRRG